MKTFTKHLPALVLAAVLVGCANPETAPRFGAVTEGDVARLAHERINRVDYYEWMGRRFVDEAELIAALEARMGEQIAAVAPQEQLAGKTLRVVLPPPAPSELGVGRFYHRLDELRLDALRQSGLFADFQVEAVSLRDPGAEGRDFLLYRAAGGWRMKDAQGRMVRLLAASSASAFVTLVNNAVTDLSGDMDYLGSMPVEGGMVFNFRGKEYTGLRGLRAAFDQQLALDEKRVVAVNAPLADTALVVLPRESRGFTAGLQNDPRWRDALPGMDAFQRYQDRRSGLFVARSGLFKSVRVVTADWAEPEQGGNDWVFWRLPGQQEWMMRPKDGVAFSESMPSSAETFAQDLRTKLTQPR